MNIDKGDYISTQTCGYDFSRGAEIRLNEKIQRT